MNFLVSSETDIGISKKTNQDSHVVRIYSTPIGRVVMAVLCDGMGGLSKGEVASASLVHAFCNWADQNLLAVCQNPNPEQAIHEEWNQIAVTFNEKIKLYGKSSGINMGTTVTAMLLMQDKYFILNVGDSRAYEIGDFVQVLTRDQTVVAREVEMGILTEEQAKMDPRRSVLLQCIGASESVYPVITSGATRKDCVYMLCSDGFRHEISEEEIYACFQPDRMTSQEEMRQNELALIELNKRRQERDNITVITIRTF